MQRRGWAVGGADACFGAAIALERLLPSENGRLFHFLDGKIQLWWGPICCSVLRWFETLGGRMSRLLYRVQSCQTCGGVAIRLSLLISKNVQADNHHRHREYRMTALLSPQNRAKNGTLFSPHGNYRYDLIAVIYVVVLIPPMSELCVLDFPILLT